MADAKRKFLNASLIATSLVGYLEWATENHMFLVQGEAEVLSKLIRDPVSVAHPFTLLPLFGQIVVLITLFQKRPSRGLTYIGIACLGLLIVLMFVIGIISLNYKIFLSTLPFIITSVLAINESIKR